MLWQQHERISAGNKAHTAPGRAGRKDAARRDWIQHPQWGGSAAPGGLWKVGLSPTAP